MYNVALLCSFYNELGTVENTLRSFRSYTVDGPAICIQSSFGSSSSDKLESIQKLSTKYIELPNLASKFHKYELPAYAVCRNFSAAFTELQLLNRPIDFVIAILGDTYVYDFSLLINHISNVMAGKKAAVLQAIGQNFHSADADPVNGKIGGRPQVDGITTDIMPQLIILSGDIYQNFTKIEVTNRFTTEENLGNVLDSACDFHRDVVRLNGYGAYNFHVGVRLQH